MESRKTDRWSAADSGFSFLHHLLLSPAAVLFLFVFFLDVWAVTACIVWVRDMCQHVAELLIISSNSLSNRS